MLAECFGALLQAVGASQADQGADQGADHGNGEEYRIRLEGDMDLSFTRYGDALAVNMQLADIPGAADARRELLRKVLRIGLGLMPENGADVFLVPSLAPDGRLMLQSRLPAEPHAFVRAVELFLNGAEKWRLAIRREKTSPFRPQALSFARG